MKANNLTICIPNAGCDKKCEYCISRITGYTKYNFNLYEKNIKKVKRLADTCGVTSVLLTGKGEPFLNLDSLLFVINDFNDYPIEIQTNGIILNTFVNTKIEYNNLEKVDDILLGTNIIAISIDDLKTFHEYENLFNYLDKNNIITRVTLIISDRFKNLSFSDIIQGCKTHKIKQLTFRNLTIPLNDVSISSENISAVQWIKNNTKFKVYNNLIELFESQKDTYPILRQIRIGEGVTKIYDVDGVAFTYFDYCVQDTTDNEEIRSLIYQEDGHLYTSWSSKASILF